MSFLGSLRTIALAPLAGQPRLRLWGMAAAISLLWSGGLPQASPALTLAQVSESKAALAAAEALVAQGDTQLDQQQYQAAAQTFQQAIQQFQAIQASTQVERTQNELAKAWLLLGENDQAIALLQKIIPLAENQSVHANRLTNLALGLLRTGRLPEAEQALRSAIADWEQIRTLGKFDASRITLFEQQVHTYRLLQKVLVAQSQTNAALEIAEASRGRSLVELLAQRTETSGFQTPTLSQIQQIARSHNATLVQYAIVGQEARVLGYEREDETDLYIWVIQPTGEVAFRRVDLTSVNLSNGNSSLTDVTGIANLVRNSRSSIGLGTRGLLFQENQDVVARATRDAKDQASQNKQFQELYRLLIQPIADLLPQDPTARVIFIPQGPLFLVPFVALQDPQGQYLIEKHTILTSPSIQLLALTEQQRQRLQSNSAAPKTALVVGNPVMPKFPIAPGQPPQPLTSLPGAEVEAKAIALLLQTQALVQAQATKAAVLRALPQSRIVHLATHGLLDIDPNLNEFGVVVDRGLRTARQSGVRVTPGAVVVGPGVIVGGVEAETALAREKVVQVQMPGLIALAASGQDNGFLSAKEILELRLQADLVVLSACNTGRGRVTGDGVIGLTRAFIAAGVPSVIVSLWSVPDAPTSTLMAEFYRTLAEGNHDKARALRQAMLITLKQYPDPRDWAAFTLVGEAE